MEMTKREDHRLRVTIQSERTRIENVRCKVYLPTRLMDPILLTFYPTEEQYDLFHVFQGTVRGEVKGSSGSAGTRILANNVYFLEKHHSPIFADWVLDEEAFVVGKPTDLRITRPRIDQDSASPKGVTGSFWLTPSEIFVPDQVITNSYTGDRTIDIRRKYSFTLANGLHLVFSEHFRHVRNENGDDVTFSKLVAEFESTEPPLTFEPTNWFSDLDDFLLIASFITGWRCMCLGWEAVTPEGYTTFYRRDVRIPTLKSNGLGKGLVSVGRFDELMKIIYSQFVDLEQKELIRQALQYLVSCYEGNIGERSFLVLYAALESLILWFRRKAQLETILLEEQWRQLRKELKECINHHPQLHGDQQKGKREGFYKNLLGLNKISLSKAFEQFCGHYAVDLRDLWPVFSKTKEISLSTIRNKIIHGALLEPLAEKALITANVHLQWTVVRLILAIFRWPVNDSSAGIGDMEWSAIGAKDWEPQRRVLSALESFRAPLNS